jgi:hypothetical protein
MIGTSGWDALVLTVRTTAEGVELRVGAVFAVALAWIAYKIIVWFEEDDKKATG